MPRDRERRHIFACRAGGVLYPDRGRGYERGGADRRGTAGGGDCGGTKGGAAGDRTPRNPACRAAACPERGTGGRSLYREEEGVAGQIGEAGDGLFSCVPSQLVAGKKERANVN